MKFVTALLISIFFFAAHCFGVVTVSPDNPDIRYTGVIERINGSSGMELYRLHKSYIDAGTGQFWSADNAGTQTGITILIKTASPTVAFNFSINSNYEDRWSEIALYRNGSFYGYARAAAGTALNISGTNATGASVLWSCVLPGFRAQYFNNIELADGYSLETITEPRKPVYVAIGNSNTHGVGQTASATRFGYAWQTAQYFGYELYNFAVGGSKINTDILNNFSGLPSAPKLITVLWGYNDVNAPWDLSESMARYETLMTNLVSVYKNSMIAAIEQTYTTTTTGAQNPVNSISRLRTEQRTILENLQASHKNLFIINGLDYTSASSLVDAVHLNDQGAKDLADGLVSKIAGFSFDTTLAAASDTIIFRSEYENVGDTLFTIPGFKQLFTNSSDLTNVTVSATGDVIVATEIADTRNSVHAISLMAEQLSGDTLRMLVVDIVDYLTVAHGGTALDDHRDFHSDGDWTAFNNLWGTENATTTAPQEDYRMAIVYTDKLPDSTLIVWDVAYPASLQSVWNYTNLFWGNRLDVRTDLSGFPFKLNAWDSLILGFDYTTLHDGGGHKIALNLFTQVEDTLVAQAHTDGDFFMTFDQLGTWVPAYPDTLHSGTDTTILGVPYILMHKLDPAKNDGNYRYRRAIVKNEQKVEQGGIDLMQLFDLFNSKGYMDKDLSVSHIMFGVEVSEGMGAVRINSISIEPKNAGTMLGQSSKPAAVSYSKHYVAGNFLIVSPLTEGITKFSVYTIQGKNVKSITEKTNRRMKLNITDLSPGYYISRLETVGGKIVYSHFLKR